MNVPVAHERCPGRLTLSRPIGRTPVAHERCPGRSGASLSHMGAVQTEFCMHLSRKFCRETDPLFAVQKNYVVRLLNLFD